MGIEPTTSAWKAEVLPLNYTRILIILVVGKTGFEPATPWSQTKCSTKLSYSPLYGAPDRSRTHNLLIRSQTLYPIELRAHFISKSTFFILTDYQHKSQCFFDAAERT